tara:strand:- start:918 stop:1163 length:246 start_codon:yes stop_codon:yes gene_type:complete
MDKKEKYYNYVVNDIVKNTDIDYDREKIKFPFYNNSIFFSFLPLSSLFSRFSKHVIERYGVHDEEIKIIWYQYKEKIQPFN